MAEVPLYNSSLIKTYVEYLRQKHPQADITALLKGSGITDYQLEDGGHWFTQEEIDNFYYRVALQVDGPSSARESGRYSAIANASGLIRQYAASFLTPMVTYWMVEKLAVSLTRHATFKVSKSGQNSVEIIVTQRPGVREKAHQCENRIGIFEAVGLLFTKKYAQVEHPHCIHRGQESCRYLVSWERQPYEIWELTGKFIGIAGLVSALPMYWVLDIVPWLLFVALFLMSCMGTLFYSRTLRCLELEAHLENQGNASNLLIEQINLRYSQASLIRELGQASANILDTEKLLDFFMVSIEKRLDFKRGLLLLANPGKSRIIFAAAFGYDDQDKDYLKTISFNLDNPHSQAPFVVAFKEMKAIIVNDLQAMEATVSAHTREFIKRLRVTSFICAPILFEGEPLGLLALDSLDPERPYTESDISLITGIAHQIAISLHLAAQHRGLRESEQRFRTLTENAPDIIYSLDDQGNLTYLNQIWEKVMGQSRREAVGGKLDRFCDETEGEKLRDMQEKILKGRLSVKDINLTLRRRDGAERLFNVSGIPWLDDSGQAVGVIGIMKDVTEHRRLEAQLQQAGKMESLGRLTGGVSHDFNNLLQAIGGYTQLLLSKKKPDDPERKFLSNIEQLTQKARDLIKQLLFFSRKAETAFQVFDLNDEIKNFKELLATLIPKMINIKLALALDLRFIRADKVQIHQTIMNMVINARDAMPKGGELIIATNNVNLLERHWRKKFWIEPGKYVELVFSDNGPGIDQVNLEHIFEPFFTTKEVGKGTGMGLSVVYGIVKNHGGYIWCESTLGVGTSFHLYFPATDSPGEVTKVAPPAVPGLEKGAGEAILLVDDEESIRETTAEILALNGYRVITATSGEDALELYGREKDAIDLVVLDLIMPGMGGGKCLRELRKIDPGIKVIISSGFTAQLGPETQEETGPVRFVAKPYDYDFFVDQIKSVLHG